MGERIRFDRSLYLPEAVDAAATAYAEHAQIDVTTTADAVVAELSARDADEQRTVVNAFCNHVLHETIARRRQAALEEDA
jgi:hypothetical protein